MIGAAAMDVTNLTAAVTGVRHAGSARGRIAVAAAQIAAMFWMGAAAEADQPRLGAQPPPAATVEIVPQQEASDDRRAPTPTGADIPAVKPLREISFNISVTGEAPANVTAPASGPIETAGGREVRRGFADSMYFWQASNVVHRPLYFEQRYVERYGANFGRLQPIASGVQFAADTALLPAKMLVHPPRECVYSLGYGRPGSGGTPCPRY